MRALMAGGFVCPAATAAWLLLFSAAAPAMTCATCHKAEALSQPRTSMGHALELVEDCTILREHPRLTFQFGRYSYTITRNGNQSIYSVTDGTDTITVPIGWAFGLGEAGQTYVFERGGIFYESRVSFYKAVGGLDLTFGAAGTMPKNLVQAAGREMTHEDVTGCFACHATNSVRDNTFHPEELKAGVRCENCHTEALRHMQAVMKGDVKNAAMPHLANMTAEETNEFCGRCHRTWEDIAAHGPHNIANVRFQPYRLTNSKCYDADDRRIRCTACHNPHEEYVAGAGHYDAKCQACHNGSRKTCPVAKQGCTNCHMPKISLPGAHRQFTDHQIRVVRAGEPYPE
ncbi:MAG TPA: multiheme c-type cytochrome [Bryobacteraceae bacterium]|nr:multiheme c-type cytochrome [Bryobacteraceae bacterium]